MGRDNLPVKQSLTQQPPRKMEVQQVIIVRNAAVGVDLQTHLVYRRMLEKCKIWVEEQFGSKLEPFSRNSTRVKTFLSNKLEPVYLNVLKAVSYTIRQHVYL